MRVYLLILLAVLSSCQKADDRVTRSEASSQADAIVGTWKSVPVDEGRRERFIEMTFTSEGRVTDYSLRFIDSKSGEISGTTPMEGTYTVRDGKIHWNMGGSKAEIPYWIEGDTMHQTLGSEKLLFKRQSGPIEGNASSATS